MVSDIRLHLYSGAGNLFLLADGRKGHCVEEDIKALQTVDTIQELCARHGTDGLMVIEDCGGHDFRMVYYNPDGSGGMMCGNGGRCIVAFAADLGVAMKGEKYMFEAPDGLHEAEILSTRDGVKTVRLKMIDVAAIDRHESLEVKVPSDGYFLNTGTRHYVRFINDVDTLDLETEGRAIRWAGEFAPAGTNVNYVTPRQTDGGTLLDVRTFEKGVERETQACGTGIVASAIAAYTHGITPTDKGESVRYAVKARGGDLAVDFVPAQIAVSVYLTGPAVELPL